MRAIRRAPGFTLANVATVALDIEKAMADHRAEIETKPYRRPTVGEFMSADVFEKVVIVVVSLSVSALLAFRMWLHRPRTGPPAPEGLERLPADLSDLRDEVARLRDEIVDLHERVDFTERFITKGTPSA